MGKYNYLYYRDFSRVFQGSARILEADTHDGQRQPRIFVENGAFFFSFGTRVLRSDRSTAFNP
jgi:hypothetical protein